MTSARQYFPIAIISTFLKGNKLNKTLENKVYID